MIIHHMNDNPRELEIRIDLISDISAHVRDTLIALGYRQHSLDRVANDPHRLISCYFGVTRRRSISSHPREIHKSNRFLCPEGHLGALAKIEKMIATGDDLTAYFRRKIMELRNVDVMLNAWRVHHLHLGERVESKGKNKGSKERTKSLLYCYFTDTDAYLIDVMDHDSFGSQTVIEIMHENWPELLNGFRIPGVTPYVRLSDEQTFELTRAGYSTFTTTRDGTVYMPPGGGVMWSGDNAIDIMKTNQLLNRLHHMQTSIMRFIERDKDNGVPPYTLPIELRLCVLDNEYCVEDVENGDIYRVAEYGVVRMSGGV